MNNLLSEIRSCVLCKEVLPNAPKPIIQSSRSSRIVIVGQAPGQKVHNSGNPWDDASGNNLRAWLGVNRQTFYDEKLFSLIPMGFCFPGTGKTGDLPPRPECAPHWHHQIIRQMTDIKLILLVGHYAQSYYLGNHCKSTLTETVKNFRDYLPRYLPLPHPSPRNNIWQRKNSWFREDVIPLLQERIWACLKPES